jgi:hypothetical protein
MSAIKNKQVEYWDLDESHLPWVQCVLTMDGPQRTLELIGFDGNGMDITGEQIFDEEYDIDTHNILIAIGIIDEED